MYVLNTYVLFFYSYPIQWQYYVLIKIYFSRYETLRIFSFKDQNLAYEEGFELIKRLAYPIIVRRITCKSYQEESYLKSNFIYICKACDVDFIRWMISFLGHIHDYVYYIFIKIVTIHT